MTMDLFWAEPAGPRRGPRPAFTLAEVTHAAIAVADAEGLAAVTMQRVADALGVTKMALYRYVPGKSELVALMTDLVMGDPPSPGTAGWRDTLDAWARALFATFAAHPWTLESTVGARPTGPNELAWLERAVAALAGTGLTGPEMLDTAVLLTGHVRSLAQQTAGLASERTLTVTIATVSIAHADRYPALASLFTAMRGAPPAGEDDALRYGLDRILDGLATLIATRDQARAEDHGRLPPRDPHS